MFGSQKNLGSVAFPKEMYHWAHTRPSLVLPTCRWDESSQLLLQGRACCHIPGRDAQELTSETGSKPSTKRCLLYVALVTVSPHSIEP